MGKGFVIAEQGHVAQMIYSTMTGAVAAFSGGVFSMKNWGHATILCLGGAGSATRVVKLYNVSGSAGLSAVPMTFRYAIASGSAGGMLTPERDKLDAALAWGSTLTLAATAQTFGIIEIDADELAAGLPCVFVYGNNDMAVPVILSGGRYQEDITASALG